MGIRITNKAFHLRLKDFCSTCLGFLLFDVILGPDDPVHDPRSPGGGLPPSLKSFGLRRGYGPTRWRDKSARQAKWRSRLRSEATARQAGKGKGVGKGSVPSFVVFAIRCHFDFFRCQYSRWFRQIQLPICNGRRSIQLGP